MMPHISSMIFVYAPYGGKHAPYGGKHAPYGEKLNANYPFSQEFSTYVSIQTVNVNAACYYAGTTIHDHAKYNTQH
jgi:hypothetical protein